MKKLIQFITPISVVLTATTPLIVSCGNNNKEEEIDCQYDLTNPFNPAVTPSGGTLDLSQATKTYLKAANKNKKIIADDLANTWYQLELPRAGYTSLTVKSVGIDTNNSLITISYKSEGNVLAYGDIMTSQEVRFENIPIFIDYNAEIHQYNTKWGMGANINNDWLLTNDQWHYYQKDTYQSAGVLEHDWNMQKLIDDPQQSTDIELIMTALMFSLPSLSYYLSETSPK